MHLIQRRMLWPKYIISYSELLVMRVTCDVIFPCMPVFIYPSIPPSKLLIHYRVPVGTSCDVIMPLLSTVPCGIMHACIVLFVGTVSRYTVPR